MKKLLSIYQDTAIRYFLVGMFIYGIAVGLYTGVLNNYLHEVLSISRMERGIVEFPRELPGLLLFAVFAVLYRFSEVKFMRLAFCVALIGLIGLAFFGTWRALAIVLIVLWSWGEHLIMPVRQSIAIHAAKPGKEGLAMGSVSSVGNVGKLIGHYLIPVVFLVVPLIIAGSSAFSPYRITFVIAAVVLAIAILATLKVPDRHRHVKKLRLYFKKKYMRYFILEMFFGARKQVFVTFAPYVLILNYGARTELIASLHGIWALANIALAPLAGKLLDRVGYKKVIVGDTIVLVLLCLMYGFSHHIMPRGTAFIVICCVFVLDAMLFVLGIARAIYVKSMSASQEEVTSTLSTGISINHLVSIVIAIVGGLLWEALGIEVLFSMAALFGLGSFVFALSLPGPRQGAVD